MKKYVSFYWIILSSFVYGQSSLSTSLTACYALDGNAMEPINSLTGTLSAVTPTVNRFSQANSALAFNGTPASYVQLPNNPLIKPNAISFSCWTKTNITNAGQYVVYTNNTCASWYEGYILAYTNIGPNQYRFQAVKSNSTCSGSGQIILYGNTTTISANTWYHVGFYAGPDSIKIYLNGILDGAIANSNPLVYNPTKNVYLGGTNQSPNLPLNGSIDNVRIYNRKLSNTEFYQLFSLDPSCQPQPVASFSMSASNVCVNQPISLQSTSTNSPSTFSWTMSGGTPSASAVFNPTVSYTNAGTYTISLVATNAFGSSVPTTQTVNVATCIGINELANDKSFYVFPNPTHSDLNIIGTDKGSKIKVFNALGVLVFEAVAESEKEKVNFSQQSQGIYFITFIQDGKPFTTKIIKD